MRSSAEPFLLFFDRKSNHATIMLKGQVCEAPTIIYIPYDIHYAPEFTVWVTAAMKLNGIRRIPFCTGILEKIKSLIRSL